MNLGLDNNVDELRFVFKLSQYDDVKNNAASSMIVSWTDQCPVMPSGLRIE